MVKSPVFSIVMPTHNRADVIKFAIESVLAQTEQNFEFLIIGDGCTDNTAAVIKPYLKDSRIKWFDLPKAPGFGYANRNVVLKQAKGKYIAYMAHDDLILTDHLELCRQQLDSSDDIKLVYSRPLYVNPQGDMMPLAFNLGDARTMKEFMKVGSPIPSSNVAHRRSCFDEVGYLNDKLLNSADWDLWRRMVKRWPDGWAFITDPTCLHFLAIWRKEMKNWLHVMLKEAAIKNDFYPKELQQKVGKGQLEQEVFWQQIKKNPKGWSKMVRQASADLLDGSTFYLLAQYANPNQELTELREENEHLRRSNKEIDAHLKNITGSKAWQSFQKIRGIQARLRR